LSGHQNHGKKKFDSTPRHDKCQYILMGWMAIQCKNWVTPQVACMRKEDRGLAKRKTERTSPPLAYSMTRNKCVAVSITSYNRMIWGWLSNFMILTSRYTILSVLASNLFLLIILMAT
jgi:hypothetical protein